MATQALREELLHLLRLGSQTPHEPHCMGYTNLCTCPLCEAHGEQNALILYAERRGLTLDRPAAVRLLMRYSRRKAKTAVAGMIEAAKRKAA